jgi:OLD-like protein
MLLEDRSRAVVLVEGASDQVALETLARRRGLDLEGRGVSIVAMGGSKNVTRYLERFGPHGLGLRVASLYDAGEEEDIRRSLERAGFGADLVGSDVERLGFFVCVEDLEDELIRSVGAEAVQRLLEAHGDLGSFRMLQKQPAWQGRPVERQLRRFMGSGGSRKVRYAPRLVEALDLVRVPRSLDRVLDHAVSPDDARLA